MPNGADPLWRYGGLRGLPCWKPCVLPSQLQLHAYPPLPSTHTHTHTHTSIRKLFVCKDCKDFPRLFLSLIL